MTTITCYTGSIYALSYFLYHPESTRVIHIGDNKNVDQIETLNPINNKKNPLIELYMKGTKIQINKKYFDHIFNQNKKANKLEKKAKKSKKEALPSLDAIWFRIKGPQK